MGKNKVLLYDSSGWVPSGTSRLLQSFLTAAWATGTRLFPGRSIGAASWAEAYRDLDAYQAKHGVGIRVLHVWGHGSAGHPHLGPVGRVDLDRLHDCLPELRVVWWRSCSVHADRSFAQNAVDKLEATSVGHCEVISIPPWRQAACCGIVPGEQPHWRRAADGWVTQANGGGFAPLPAISTTRTRVPWNKDLVWSPAVRATQ